MVCDSAFSDNASTREVQLKTDLNNEALREQQLKTDFASASAREQSLKTDLEHAFSREQRLKADLDSASIREQSFKTDLETSQQTCQIDSQTHLATQRDLEAQLKPFKSPTFTIQKCYFTTTKRALTEFYIKDAEMMAYKCKHICRSSRFFELSDATSCYCGDVLSEELVEAGDAVCRVKCGGDRYACGGEGGVGCV